MCGAIHWPDFLGRIGELRHVRKDHGVGGQSGAQRIGHRHNTGTFHCDLGTPFHAGINDLLGGPRGVKTVFEHLGQFVEHRKAIGEDHMLGAVPVAEHLRVDIDPHQRASVAQSVTPQIDLGQL